MFIPEKDLKNKNLDELIEEKGTELELGTELKNLIKDKAHELEIETKYKNDMMNHKKKTTS